MTGIHTSDRAMVYTACPVFLYGGKSDNPLPPLTTHQHGSSRVKVSGRALRLLGLRGGGGLPWKRVRTTSSGWKVATVAKPAVAPAPAFSQVHASVDGGGVPGGISGERCGGRFAFWELAAARVLQGKLALTTRSCAVSTSAFHCLDGPHLFYRGNLAQYSVLGLTSHKVLWTWRL